MHCFCNFTSVVAVVEMRGLSLHSCFSLHATYVVPEIMELLGAVAVRLKSILPDVLLDRERAQGRVVNVRSDVVDDDDF